MNCVPPSAGSGSRSGMRQTSLLAATRQLRTPSDPCLPNRFLGNPDDQPVHTPRSPPLRADELTMPDKEPDADDPKTDAEATSRGWREAADAPSGEDVARFIQMKWKSDLCNVCEDRMAKWIYDPKGGSSGIPIRTKTGNPANKIRPAILVTCASCGNTRIFSSVLVNRWLQENRVLVSEHEDE